MCNLMPIQNSWLCKDMIEANGIGLMVRLQKLLTAPHREVSYVDKQGVGHWCNAGQSDVPRLQLALQDRVIHIKILQVT